MLLADRGLPSARLILVTLLGGALAAASANTLNCYIDRDIDAVMKRTAGRPLVARAAGHGGTGAAGGTPVKPAEALASGILLGAASTLLLGLRRTGWPRCWPTRRSCSTSSSTRSC